MPGQGSTDYSFKDLVDRVAGKEPDPVVYEFNRPGGKKGFVEKANQENQGVYALTGEDNP